MSGRGPLVLAFAALVAFVPATSSQIARPRSASDRVAATFSKLSLDFESNQGQADSRARYLARGAGYAVALEENGSARLALGSSASNIHALDLQLLHAQRSHPRGIGPNTATSNYFIGNSPERWKTHIAHYNKVLYPGVYPGIDLLYHGNQKRLEHDFIISPGADPDRITLTLRGADSLRVNSAGDLELGFDKSRMVFERPVAYQENNGEHQMVECSYKLRRGHKIGFVLGKYDRSRKLVIDPILAYSTLLGGSNDDRAYGIAVDSQGNAYVTGFTMSAGFPTQNPFQAACANSCSGFDVFITKFNPIGSALVYSTYLGGSGNDKAYAIAVDPSGNAYVTGYTNSSDFPMINAAQSSFFGLGPHAFVTKLNAAGSALTYSTYLGGTGTESGDNPVTAAIAVDSSGNAYVGGGTSSTDFPVLNAAFSTNTGSVDGYVAKYGPTGTKLFATYLGGNSADGVRGIALDSANPPNIYVTGDTASNDFPTTKGAFQTICGTQNLCNPSNAFVTKFSNTGAVVYSTYLGGDQADRGNAIAVDSSGNAYVTGSTTSSSSILSPNGGFPVLGGVQGACIGCNSFLSDSFVTKLNSTGSALVYSTYLGGNGDTEGTGIGVDSSGFAYVTGFTTAPDFLLSNPFQASGGGSVFKVTSAGAISPSNAGFANSSVGQFAADSTGIYAVALNVGQAEAFGLYKSTDGGNTWSKLANAPTGINVIALDPSNAGTVYGSIGYQGFNNAVAKSTDGGNTWTSSTTGLPTGTTATNFDSIAIDPSNPKRVFVGTGAGIFLSTDSGSTFASSSTGLPSPGFTSTNYINIKNIIIDSATPATIYANLTGNAFGNTVIGIYKSTDGGAHWAFSSTGLQPASSSFSCCNNVSSLAMDPNNHQILYAGTPSQFGTPPTTAGLFKTTNGAGSWTEALDSAGNSDITALALDSSSNLYAGLSRTGQRNGLLKSADGGVNWTDLGLDGGDVRAILPGSTTLAGTSDNLAAGGFSSLTFPAVTGDPTAYIARLNQAGDSLDYSTYLGGTNASQASAIAVNPSTGDAYLAGTTDSNFPTTNGAFDTTPHQSQLTFTSPMPAINGLNNDAFITKYPGALASTTLSITSINVTDTVQTPGLFDGDLIDFALAVKNTGTNPAAGVLLFGTVPSNFDPTTITASPFCTVNKTARTYQCIPPTVLLPGASWGYNVFATAINAGSFNFAAGVQADNAPPATNSASGTTQPQSQLVVSKTMMPQSGITPVNVGDVILIDISLKNNGPDVEPLPDISDQLPAGLTNCMVVASNGFPAANTDISATNLLTATGSPLAVYPPAANLHLRCTVGASLAGTSFTNTITASGANHAAPGSVLNFTTPPLAVNPVSGLTIQKTMSPSPVALLDYVTITITVKNGGPGAVENATVTDQLPALFLTPAFPESVFCRSPQLPPGWQAPRIGPLGDFTATTVSMPAPPDPNSTATITFQCLASRPGTTTNTATVTDTAGDNITSVPAPLTISQPVPPTVTPNPINGGNVLKGGQTASLPITFTNPDPSLNLHSFSFTVTPGTNGFVSLVNDNCTGATVAPGASCGVKAILQCSSLGTASGSIAEADSSTAGGVTVPYSFICSSQPGPATQFQLNASPSLVAGTSSPFTIRALDLYRNFAQGYAGTVHFTSSDGTATLPADSKLTNGAGSFMVTLYALGFQTITAMDTTTTTIVGTSNNINVTGSTPSSLTPTLTQTGTFRVPCIWSVPVTPSTATGVVQAYVGGAPTSGGTPYGPPVTITGGQATVSLLLPPARPTSLTFQYLGDSNNAGVAVSAPVCGPSPFGPESLAHFNFRF